MGSSLVRPRLYRKLALAVIFATLAYAALAQYAKKTPKTTGPRALGVLQLAANGKAHLVPVTIMINGKFYDAAAYKADPIPMALQPETVYEAIKTGASQGLFVIAGAMRDPGNGWFADGKWRSNEQIDADKAKRKAEQEKLSQKAPEVEQGPPKLKRGIPVTDQTPPTSSGDKTSSSAGGPSDKSPAPSDSKSDSSKPSKDTSGGTVRLGPAPSVDTGRPILRRQPVSDTAREQTKADIDTGPLQGTIQLIAAISDASGPEPRPYKCDMKPEEEQARLKKILAMATEEVKARAKKFSETEGPKAKRPTAQDVQFKDVQMRVFDLSSTNEPVLALTANATVAGAARDLTYMTVVVAREDIYADLHKVFAETTDNQHLDALPKYDLIDAVDADGDGRGELLFKLTWDNGSAFSVYRVIGDRLWPLFEGKPGT